MSKPAASQLSKGNQSQPRQTTASHEGRSPAQTPPGLASPYDDILALQQTVGNRAVNELLQSNKDDHSLPTKGIPPVIQSVLKRGDGQPLDSVTRGSMEARFGKDFSRVRVHTDAQAAMSAQAVDADAYTVGSHIAFNRDQYKPHTEEGRNLLSHELSHVLQQQVAAPEVQLARKRKKQKKQKDPKPLDLDDPAVRGRTFEKIEANAWKQDLHKQGYTEIFINKEGDFKTSELLKRAFTDKRAGPDLVAIDHKNKKILVGDITAGAWSQTDIKPGGKRQLPHDIGAPEEQRPHLDKTVDDAKQLARNLPDQYKDYTVVARDRYREDVRTQYSVEVVVRKGVAPPTGGSSKTPTDKPSAPGRTAQKNKATTPSTPSTPPTPSTPTAPPTASPASPSTSTASAPTPAAPPPRPVVRPPRPPSPAAIQQQQMLMNQLEQQTRSGSRLTSRIRTYVRAAGVLFELLGVLDTIDEAMQMASSGTVLPDAQRQANRINAQAYNAANWAQEVSDGISLLGALGSVIDATERGDSEALADLDNALGDFAQSIREPGERFQQLASDLRARSQALRQLSELYGRMKQVPQGASTGPQASQFAMELSLEKLSGTLGSAADRYSEAAAQLTHLTDFADQLAYRANQEFWAIALRPLVELERQQEQQRRQEQRQRPPAERRSHPQPSPQLTQPTQPAQPTIDAVCPSCHAQQRQWQQQSEFGGLRGAGGGLARPASPEEVARLREWIQSSQR